jgi:2-phospho-L-lactate/phosphoenolpyruvate guanylyltransferase
MAGMQPHVTPVAWTLLVPLKPLVRAKSRLAATAGEGLRPRLALAFAQDTVSAALACTAVRGVAVVTNDEHASAALSALGARVVPDTPDAGLNAALAHGASAIREQEPDTPVAALNADLPALKSSELAHVLHCAALYPRSFLSDAAGTGTTFLSALPGHALSPAFGGASRARHLSSGAAELKAAGVDSVRQDVDTGADLRAATVLGTGPFTARLLVPEQDGRTATEHTTGYTGHLAH